MLAWAEQPVIMQQPSYKTWGKSRAVRLPGPNRGPGAVAVTIVVKDRRPLLVAPRDVRGALDADLGRSSADGHCQIHLACFMPDHVHLVLELDGKARPLWEYIRFWKTRWTQRLAEESERPIWQRSFYDHWMRNNEVEEYARYILANPVRKGLVAKWQDYPFTRLYRPL
jgi:REP element-mobilizing transposase RayT